MNLFRIWGSVPVAPSRIARWTAFLGVAALVVACASSAPDAGASAPAASAAAEMVFTSPLYGYSATLTTAWRIVPASDAWDGEEVIGHEDAMVDQLVAPQVGDRCENTFRCGPNAWALAYPATDDLATVVASMDAREVEDHDCPATPEEQSDTEIDGEPAILSVTHCPEGAEDGGLMIVRAIAIHDGTAYYFWIQDPSSIAQRDLEPLMRSDFEALLAEVDLPD